MTDNKVSGLNLHTSPASEDLLLVIDNPNGTPVGKNITLKIFFGNVPANTSITGLLTVSGNATFNGANTNMKSARVTQWLSAQKLKVTGNTFIIQNQQTPSSNGAGLQTGTICYDANYVYVKTSNTVMKRAALSTF